jgi:flagellar protein FliO/FliZ
LMIGGPTDIVVEPNIVRAIPATRDIGRAPAGIEAITRAIPLPDNGGGSWPLQPDANGGSRPGQRADAPHDDIPGRPQSEPRQRDTLAALADELSTRMTPPPRNRGSVAEPARPEQRQEPRQEHRQEQRQEQRQEPHRQEPRLEPRKPAQAAAPAAPPPSTPSATSDAAAGGDQNLADMAQRLEAALRKPPGEGRPAGTHARPATSPEAPRSEASSSLSPRNPRGGEQRPAASEAGKPNQNKTAIYDTLEQEMANLLGRPSKT